MFVVTYVALWCVTVVLFVATFLLYRHVGRQLVAAREESETQGPLVNERVRVTLETVEGKSVEVGGESGRSHIIAFTAAGCSGCKQIQPVLRNAAKQSKIEGPDFVVVHQGDVASAREYIEAMPAVVQAVSDPQRDLSRLWSVRMTPFFVVTDSSGVVRRKGVVRSLREAESLLGLKG